MHETIFETPDQSQEESRLSWLFVDPSADTLMEDNLDVIYATNEPSLGVDEWPLR